MTSGKLIRKQKYLLFIQFITEIIGTAMLLINNDF